MVGRENREIDVIFSDSQVSVQCVAALHKQVEAMDINDLDVYKRAMRLAEEIWTEAENWPPFAKYSIGRQIIEAADSIAANISEGQAIDDGRGRYHFGENRQFCYYARGSLQETRTWLQKARSRRLISKDRFDELSSELVEIRKMLNSYINAIGQKNTNS